MPSEANDRFDGWSGGSLSGLRFSYGSVPPNVAAFLRGQADRIRRQCAISTVQIGKALIEAKRYLSHGEFVRWVECEVCIPVRSAQAYMRAAKWASDKHAAVARLSPSALYLLSAAATPEDFVTDILNRTEAGEYISPSALREELKAFRSSEQQQYVRAEISARRASDNDPKWRAVAIESEASGVVTELVAILVQKLSAADFARVRDIITSDVVLSNPRLAKNLEQAFRRTMQDCRIHTVKAALRTG